MTETVAAWAAAGSGVARARDQAAVGQAAAAAAVTVTRESDNHSGWHASAACPGYRDSKGRPAAE